MDCNYDEDLNENVFFQVLQSEQPELFQQATLEGWVICVPRSGSLPKYALTHEDFFSHILIPSDELPESHFRTLNDTEVRVCNRIITVESDISKPYSTHILFEETFYTDDLFKYKVLCTESPLEPQSCANHASEPGLITVQSLRDCIDLLWTESMGKEVLEQLDQAIRGFVISQPDLENETSRTQIELVSALYKHCLQLALKDPLLREKTQTNKHLLSNVKIAVETYMHHGIYKILIKGITACSAGEDSELNKIIRNSLDLQLRDLDVRPDLYEAVPTAKQELSHIDGYSTVLGKVGCIRRALAAITGEQVVCADDLLPILIFLVIKVGLPNWIAHLSMMQNFRFCTTDEDESSFLVTSLEAAIEHVKSGCLFGPFCPEAQVDEDESYMFPLSAVPESQKGTVNYFFYQIKLGKIKEVQETLLAHAEKSKNRPKSDEALTSLCHPLCSCDKCEDELSKYRVDKAPTLHSCDEKGLTALHVACQFGKLAIIELLIEKGAKVNSKDLQGNTPLHHSAMKGHQNALLLLLHANALPDQPDNDGNTPLHFASNNGHETCLKALLYFSEHLGQTVDVEAKNINGDTPLHHASRWGYQGIVQILLEYGARPDVKNNRRISPMDCAHSVHVSKLLTSTVKLSRKGTLGKFSLRKTKVAAASKMRLDFTDTTTPLIGNSNGVPASRRFSEGLLEYGVRPRSMSHIKKVEKLMKAIGVGDIRLACYYIGLEGNPEDTINTLSSPVKQLCHPLCVCEQCRNLNIKQDINLDSPGTSESTTDDEPLNANACNSDGMTALHASATHGRSELVPLLICAGAKVNIRTSSRSATPLHLACQNKRTATASALLDVPGCDINAQDSRGNTPLHYACLSGNAALVQVLLKHSPELTLRNMDGQTPLDEAEDKMALRMVQLLRGNLIN